MAIVSAKELDSTPARTDKPFDWWLFFPEAFIAGLLILAAPTMAIKLATQGRYVVAISLWISVWTLGYVTYIGFRDKQNWLAYLAIVGILTAGAMAL